MIQPLKVGSNIWKIINTPASVYRENMHARIFVPRHYLFFKSSQRLLLWKNKVQKQMLDLIFMSNGGYCLYSQNLPQEKISLTTSGISSRCEELLFVSIFMRTYIYGQHLLLHNDRIWVREAWLLTRAAYRGVVLQRFEFAQCLVVFSFLNS